MSKYVSTAKVIDGTLILTLPDAITPVVWQMQLGQTKSSALEVRPQNDNWVLVLKTPRMDVMEIAPFPTKALAVRALMSVSRAMEKAQGQIAPYFGNPTYPVPARVPSLRAWTGRIFRGLFKAALIIVGLFLLWVAVLWVGRFVFGPGPDAASVPPVGAPMSADDFLNNQ